MRVRTPIFVRFGIAALIGIAYPYAELAWKCRAASENSEACVWARAYFSLSRWVEPVIIAPIAFLLITLLLRLLPARKP